MMKKTFITNCLVLPCLFNLGMLNAGMQWVHGASDLSLKNPSNTTDQHKTVAFKIAFLQTEELETLPQIKRLRKRLETALQEQKSKRDKLLNQITELSAQIKKNERIATQSEMEKLQQDLQEKYTHCRQSDQEFQVSFNGLNMEINFQIQELIKKWAEKASENEHISLVLNHETIFASREQIIDLTPKILEIAWEEERATQFIEEESESAVKKSDQA